MLRIIKFIQVPFRLLGMLWYVVLSGFQEGRFEVYQYLVKQYNKEQTDKYFD